MSDVSNIIEIIRAGLADEVDEMTRQRARKACDDLAAVLGSKPGEPISVPDTPAQLPLPSALSRPPGVPNSQRIDPSLLLDAVIAKLKSALPNDTTEAPAAAKSLHIPFVQIPPGGGTR